MYRVLIADDEAWVIESLKKSIPWREEGYEVTDTALSGDAALKVIERSAPHLVLADIRMPGMSGLDLIRESRSRGYAGEFIVVSGYAEFAYAQKALQYGVAGYCLKPVEADEVVAILRRLRRAFDRDSSMTPPFSDAVTRSADLEDGSPLLQLLSKADSLSESPPGPLRVVVADLPHIDPRIEQDALLSVRIGATRFAWVLTDASYRVHRDAMAADDTATPAIGVSRPVEATGALHGAILEAIVAAKNAFMGPSPALVEYDRGRDPSGLRSALHSLESAIHGRSAGELDRAFDELRHSVAETGYNAAHARFIYNSIIYFLGSVDSERSEPLAEYEDLVDLYGDLETMIAHLREMCRATIGADAVAPPGGSAPIDEVVAYVDANFVGRITLENLTKRFAISSGHLSRLFKQRTGRTITEYITASRVAYARRLLESTSIPIGHVAEECGYDSYFYFARVFKRTTGETPSAYRHRATHRTADENGPAG